MATATAKSAPVAEGINRHVESALWFGLLILCTTAQRSAEAYWIAVIAAAQVIWKDFRYPLKAARWTEDCRYFRRPTRTGGDTDGVAASAILVPVLLKALYREDESYAIVLVSLWTREYWFYAMLWSAWLNLPVSFACITCWKGLDIAFEQAKALHKIFTVGEWMIVSTLIATGITEFLQILLHDQRLPAASLHQLVALSGLVGAGIAFSIVNSLTNMFLQKIIVLASIPLLLVEFSLWHANADVPSPRSLAWIMRFLRETEQGTPRYHWILYWIAILFVTIVLAPSQHASSLVVIQRKWFHFVAVLLFTPVTFAAPQLQSLAYAVATALLLIAERLRPDLPVLDHFYTPFLDFHKGEDHKHMVISHLALVAGCAAPLWLSECVPMHSTETKFLRRVLAQSGVLTLGLGDSMGAVIGKRYGRVKWGHNRTVEGSCVMFLSMAAACCLGMYLTEEPIEQYQVRNLLLASLFVTLMEAFTVQLDNLILPLSGGAVLLLLLQ